MAVTSLGSGSGLDLNGIITSLMQVEQQPLVALQKKEASYLARISALGTLRSSLYSLQTAAKALTPSTGQLATDKFASLTASVADTSLLTASASTGATAGNYTLSNITLASAEQIRKTGFTIPTATDASEDGTLHIKVGTGTAVDVNVKGGSSLATIATAINNAATGVTASIINNGTVDYLVISAKDSGQANQISITNTSTSATANWDSFNYTSGTPSLPATVFTNNLWTQQQQPKSASVDVNGLTITSNTNTIASAIGGVSITLTKESSSGTTLTVNKDTTSSLSTTLSSFIKAYNDAAASMKNLGYYDSSTKKAGALQGDSTLRSSQSQVRNMLQAKAGGTSAYQTLSDVGVTIEKDGTLSLNSTTLNKAIAADYSGVAKLVSTAGSAFKDGIESLIGTSGNIAAASDSSSLMIKALTAREATISNRLTGIEARYRKQFTALDNMIAGLKTTSTYLTQQLANLPGATPIK